MKLDFKNDLFLRQVAIKIGIILVVVIISFVAISFLSKNIKEKALNISGLQAQTKNLSTMGETFSKLMKDYQTVEPYLTSVQVLLPSQNEIINFSKDISDLAQTFNIELGFAFEKNEVKKISEGISAVGFSMSLKGDFSKAVEFIIALKDSRYFVDLTAFDFTGGSSDNIAKGVKTISAVVRGRVFIRNN
jgi:hypothetical protein